MIYLGTLERLFVKCTSSGGKSSGTDWLIDWLTGWLHEWNRLGLIDGLIDWVTEWAMKWVSEIQTDRQTDRQTDIFLKSPCQNRYLPAVYNFKPVLSGHPRENWPLCISGKISDTFVKNKQCLIRYRYYSQVSGGHSEVCRLAMIPCDCGTGGAGYFFFVSESKWKF